MTTSIKVKNNSHKIVSIPADYWLNYALTNNQAFQYCFFKGKDIEKYIQEECDTVCMCEDKVYDAT
jgi:putative hemolysin